MRFVAIAFVLCAPVAARAADVQAQALEDQGRELMVENRFQAALETLEAANQREVTPQRLMALARCHRELAYAQLREAARLHPGESVMAELAEALGEVKAQREPALREPQPMPPAAIARTTGPTPEIQAGNGAASARDRLRKQIGWTLTGSAVVLVAAAAATHVYASSLTGGLSDPATPNKPGLEGEIRSLQTGSNLLLGGGLLLGVVAASLLTVRF